MWKADQWKDYEVLDTSDGEKLERWGSFYLVRPDPQVIWSTPRQDPRWKRFDARYARSSTGGGHWSAHHLPEHWRIRYRELTFNVKPMNFKHTGVFPEQAANWDFIDDQIRRAGRPVQRAEPVCLHRRRDTRSRCGRRIRLPCGRRKGHGRLGPGKCRLPPVWRAHPSAGSSTTAPSSSSARSSAAAATTPSSWTRRPTGAARPARSGSWRRTFIPFVKLVCRRAVGRSAVCHHQFLHDRPRARPF